MARVSLAAGGSGHLSGQQDVEQKEQKLVFPKVSAVPIAGSAFLREQSSVCETDGEISQTQYCTLRTKDRSVGILKLLGRGLHGKIWELLFQCQTVRCT